MVTVLISLTQDEVIISILQVQIADHNGNIFIMSSWYGPLAVEVGRIILRIAWRSEIHRCSY
jgi:hypothetical protein